MKTDMAKREQSWLQDGIIYEVFVRQFGPTGTFRAVEERLPLIADLGVTVLWLMPIHPVGVKRKKGPMGSPYAVRDYFAVNPDLGAPDDLRSLVDHAHRLGMRLIVDWVANHTAWDNPLIDSHPDWFCTNERGEILPGSAGWSDTAKLDHANEALRGYLIEAMHYWVGQFGVDGFRCDVAGLAPTEFWEAAAKSLRAGRADLGMLAEAYSPQLMESAFDLTYDTPWGRAVRKALRGASSSVLWQAHDRFRRGFPPRAQRMRFIDNHDQKRIVSLVGEEAALAAAALLLASEGVPLIYNGQEIGNETPSKAPHLFASRRIDWAAEKKGFRDFYSAGIRRRLDNPALRFGKTIQIDDGQGSIIAFLRIAAQQTVFAAVNLCSERCDAVLESELLAPPVKVLLERFVGSGTLLARNAFRVDLDGWGALICEVGCPRA